METNNISVWIKAAITSIAAFGGLIFVYRKWTFIDKRSLLSSEECNFLRLYILVTNIGTKAVRIFFNKKISDPALAGHLVKYQSTLKHLTGEQRNLIQDPNVQSKDFDITLLYILIRNTMPKLPKPSLGWGARPLHCHKREADDIERIRHYRNNIAHNKTFLITSEEFEESWLETSQAINRLSNGCLNGEVSDLRQKIFKQSEKSLFEEEIKCIKDKVLELERDIANCQDLLVVTDTRHIPLNVRECHLEILQRWREDDTLFYTTRGCTRVINTLKENSVVVITGNAGCGKTAMAHHIALTLESQGYEVIPIGSIDEIGLYGKLGRDQIFVIDNIIGTFAVDMSKINTLEDQKEKILTILSKRSKLLLTCRKTVFNEALNLKSYALKISIDLHEKTIDLDACEKLNILTKHCENESVPKAIYETVSFPSDNVMLPLSCKFYSQNNRYQLLGKNFFERPTESMIEEMNNLQHRNNIQYAALVICLLNNNIISHQCFIPTEIKNEVYENCRLDESTAKTKILDALVQMEGSLVKRSDNGKGFTFIHDFIFEIVAYHYGRQFPYHIITYLSSGYIANKVVVGDETNDVVGDIDTCIDLQEEYFPALARRLLKDIWSLELFNVFQNKALLNQIVRQEFEKVLFDIPYDEFKVLLLYEQNYEKCLEKIISYLNCIDGFDKSDQIDMRDVNFVIEVEEVYGLLIDYRVSEETDNRIKTTYHPRIVSWVVFYGHTDLLRCIMKRVQEHGDSVNIILGENQEEQSRLLVLACFRGNVDLVTLLIENMKPDIVNSCPTYFDTCLWENIYTESNDHRINSPLTAACRAGHLEIVKLLIRHNANMDLGDVHYDTPLGIAVELGNYNIVECLLQNGAKPDVCMSLKEPPIYKAIGMGLTNIVKLLLKYGSDVNIKWGNLKWTPLHVASSFGKCDIVNVLNNNNANVNCCDIGNRTPLQVASKHGHFETVKCLIEAGGNVNLYADWYSQEYTGSICSMYVTAPSGIPCQLPSDTYTIPLFDACKEGHSKIVNLLLQNGADVNMCGPENQSPLFTASENGLAYIVSLLLKHGAQVDIKTNLDTSPLEIAFLKNKTDIVQQLITAENSVKNFQGNYHLFEIVGIFLQGKCFEEHRCAYKLAPEGLCSFIKEESWGNFTRLLKMGLDVNQCDEKGLSLVYKLVIEIDVKNRLKKVQDIIESKVPIRSRRDCNNISLLEHTRQKLSKLHAEYDRMKTNRSYLFDFLCIMTSSQTTESCEKECLLYSDILRRLKKGIRRYSV